jgi:hypothetical protein
MQPDLLEGAGTTMWGSMRRLGEEKDQSSANVVAHREKPVRTLAGATVRRIQFSIAHRPLWEN